MVVLQEGDVLDLGAISLSPIGAEFEMLGGIKDKLWPLGQNSYVKTGVLRNTSQQHGATMVTGWYRIGNYGEPRDVHSQSVSLGPGETKEISYALTRAEIEQAQTTGYEIVFAYLSVGVGHSIAEGECTLDRIYLQ